MGLQYYYLCYIIWVAIHLLFSTSSLTASTQAQGCSLVGINLQTCLVPSSQTAFHLDSCCASLSLAVEAGYHCLCSLLGPEGYPVFSTQLALSFSNCYISIPPLTHCHVLDPDPLVFAPPVAALAQPHPPPLSSPTMPVLLPPDLPRDDQFVPLPPKVNETPLNSEGQNFSTADGNSSLSSSPPPQLSVPETSDSENAKKMLLLSRNLLMIVPVFACIA
ncbi:hypothetical protein Salat_0566800 [Sesamum alatum]|uniref:Bifunctional inhibitor/plant lipid transfer protein/seed storage helical domain-containing protein n=1 Tax=Sesamum alatum TaxID=300844 RepID=A0AAE1YQC3_9LAMI|nr:hypothetical protein Salat_0566800 [Sesamum alatum]